MTTEQHRNVLPQPIHPPGCRTYTAKPPPEQRAKQIRLYTQTPPPRKGLPAGVWPLGLTPGFPKEQQKSQGPLEPEVRLGEATALYLCSPRSNILVLKLLISRGFQKSGFLDREAKFPHNPSGTSKRPRHLPKFPQVTTLFMLRGDAKQPTLTWRQLCARPHVFMTFFILSSTTVKTRLAEVWLSDRARVMQQETDKAQFKTTPESGKTLKNLMSRTSLVAQWLRILLPMQGIAVRALVREDPTCRGATKPMHHNY